MTEEIQNIEVDSWDVEIPAGDIYYYKDAYSTGYCKLRPDLILSRGPSSQPGKSAFGFWGRNPEEAENLWDKYGMENRSYDPKFLDLVGRGDLYSIRDARKALGFPEDISEFGWMPASALKKLSDDTRLSWDVTPYRVVKVPLSRVPGKFFYGIPVLQLPSCPNTYSDKGSIWAIYCDTKKEAIRKFEESGLDYSDNDKGFLNTRKHPGISQVRNFLGNQEVDWCYSDDVTYADTNEKVAWDLPDFPEITVGDHVEIIADKELLEDIRIDKDDRIDGEFEIIDVSLEEPFLWNEKYGNGIVKVKSLRGVLRLEFPYSNWRDFLRAIDKNETVSWDVSSIATGWVDSKEDYARLAKPGEVWLLHFGSPKHLGGWYLVFIGDNPHLDGNKFYDGLTIDFYIENEDDDLYLRIEEVRSEDEYTDMVANSYFKGIQLDNIGSFSDDGLETLNLYRDQIIQAATSICDLHKASWDVPESLQSDWINSEEEYMSSVKPNELWLVHYADNMRHNWYLVNTGSNPHLEGERFYDGGFVEFSLPENGYYNVEIVSENYPGEESFSDVGGLFDRSIKLDEKIKVFGPRPVDLLPKYEDKILGLINPIIKSSWDISPVTVADNLDEFISLAKPGDVWKDSEKGNLNDIYVFDYLNKVTDTMVDNCSWGLSENNAYRWYPISTGCSGITFPVMLKGTFNHLRKQSWDVELPEYKIYKYDDVNGVWYAVVPDELILPYSTGEARGSDKVAFGIWVENDKEKAIELYHKYLEGKHLSEGFLETLKRREVYYIYNVKKDLGIRDNEPEISENKNNVTFSFCNLTSINPVEDTQSWDV